MAALIDGALATPVALIGAATSPGRPRATGRHAFTAGPRDPRQPSMVRTPEALTTGRNTDGDAAPATASGVAAGNRGANAGGPRPHEALTDRENQVLGLLARGLTNVQIGHALFITEGTVKSHVKQILRKLDAANRAEAVSLWLRPRHPNTAATRATGG